MGVYSAESSRKQIKIARCMHGILLRLLRLLRQLLGHPQHHQRPPLIKTFVTGMCDLTTCDEHSSGEGVAATGKQQSKQQQRQQQRHRTSRHGDSSVSGRSAPRSCQAGAAEGTDARALDLHDLRLKRPPLSRMAYTARVKSVLKSQKAQAVASSYAGRFRRTCQEVVDRKGGAADN